MTMVNTQLCSIDTTQDNIPMMLLEKEENKQICFIIVHKNCLPV